MHSMCDMALNSAHEYCSSQNDSYRAAETNGIFLIVEVDMDITSRTNSKPMTHKIQLL